MDRGSLFSLDVCKLDRTTVSPAETCQIPTDDLYRVCTVAQSHSDAYDESNLSPGSRPVVLIRLGWVVELLTAS